MAIPWLGLERARGIVAARDSVGRFARVADMRNLAGMSEAEFEALAPYLRVRPQPTKGSGQALVRWAADTLAAGAGWAGLARVRVTARPCELAGVIEKDAGDVELADCVAFGIGLGLGPVRVLAGDYRLRLGHGLHLSSSAGRSGAAAAVPWDARPPSAAPEGPRLTGACLQYALGPWSVAAAGSSTRRDADLNPDGTVHRLVNNGEHGDSAGLARRDQLGEKVAATALSWHATAFQMTAAGAWVEYDRQFAPTDTAGSFTGQRLATAGLGALAMLGDYELGFEAARSFPGALAGAVSIRGAWQQLSVGLALRGRERGFFAPHGRWTSLAACDERLDAGGSLTWHHGGTRARVSGNTYREFSEDSMPARLRFEIGQRVGPVEMELSAGRSYRGEQERFRTTRLCVTVMQGRPLRARLLLDDAYRDARFGHGFTAALRAEGESGRVWVGFDCARVLIAGSGVSMYVPEAGAARAEGSFRTGRSAWRLNAAGRVEVTERLRVGARLGCTLGERLEPDAGMQVEMTTGG